MTSVFDDFNRPDAADLGPGWVSHNGILAIAGGMVYPTGSPNYTWCYSSSTTVMVGGDMELTVTFGPSNSTLDHVLIYVGANAAGECLFAYFYQNNAYFFTQGAWASYSLVYGPVSLTQAEGDSITLRRNGTLYEILKNGVDTGIGYATAAIPIDASHNQVGFAIYSDNGTAHRKINSVSAKDCAVDAALSGGGTLSATVKKIAPVPASLGSTGQLQVTVSPSGGETPPDGGGGTRPWEITPGTPTPHRPAPSWGSSPVLLAPHKKLGGWEAKLDRVGQFRGQGSLNAVVAPTVTVGAVFASEGTLTPNLLWRGYRTIFFGGSGSLYADPQPFLTRPISALFSGSGYLSSFIDDDGFTAIIRKGIAALLSGGGNLGVDLGGGITYPDGLSALVWARYLRIAGFSSEAQLIATLDRLQAGIAAYAGEGSLNVTVSPVIAVLAQLTGSGALTAGQAGGVTVLAQMLGSGQLSADLFARKLADAGFQGAGAMTALLLQSHTSTSTGGGEGTVSAVIFARYLMAAALSGGGTLSSLLAQVYALAGAFGGDGALSASMFQKLFSAASMSGGGTLTAGAFQSYLCSASMGGGGSLTATASIAFTPFTETNQPKTNAARPAGTSGCWVTLIGGGGSGGTGYGAAFQNCGGGGGGGGGGLISRSFIPVASLGSTYSVVIGAKGVGANGTASSFSSGSGSASANGGTKGGNGGSGSAGSAGAGGTTTISGFTGLTALNGGAGGAGTLASAGVAGANQATTAPGGGGGAGRGGAGQTYAGGKGGNSATAAGGTASGGNGAAAAAGNPGGGGAGGVSTNGTGGSAGDAGVYGAGGGGGGGGNSTGPAGDGSAGTTVIEWV